MEAPLLENESARLNALHQYAVLDLPIVAFDELTSLAAQICQTPIAAINFVDRDRVWVKSQVGLELKCVPRSISFCAESILQAEVLVIPDTFADDRFVDNPLVTEAPGIRFYAGTPLITRSGAAIGAICVLDVVPRELTPAQTEALKSLAHQAIAQLELRLQLQQLEITTSELQQAETELERFFNLSLDLLCVAGVDGYFKRVNPAFESTLGYTTTELLSRSFLDFVHPEDRPATFAELEKLATGNPTINFENRYLAKNGVYRWLAWKARPMQKEGLVYAIARDITAQKKAEIEHFQLLNQEKIIRAEAEKSKNQVIKILESITDAFFALDSNFYFTYLNQQAEKLLARKREDLLGKSIWAEFPEAVNSTFYHEYHRAFTQQISVEFEEYYPPLDSWFAVHAYPSGTGLSVYFQNINERKEVDRALRESEERYRLLFQNNPHPMWVYNLQTWEFLAVNEAAIQHYGYSRQEFLNLKLHDLRPAEALSLSLKKVAEVTSGLHKAGIFKHQKKDGTIIHVEITSHTLNFSGKNAEVVLVNDISERLIAEAQLLETTTLQKAILDSANYTIISTTVEGIILTFNAAAQRLLGYTATEVINKVTPEIIHDFGEVKQRANELTTELGINIEPGFEVFVAKARQGKTEEREWTYIRKDGSRFPVLLSITALRNQHGEITGFLGIGSDITESKKVTQALKESEERWQLALRGNSDGIWDWNLVTNEVFFSARWKEMLGYEDHEITNNFIEWEKRVHPDDLEWVKQKIQDHFAKKIPFYITEHRMRCRDGSYKWILDRGQALWDAEGNVVRMAGSHTDITERKQAEAKIREQAALLDVATDAILVRNLDQKIVFWNKGAERLYGWKVQEALGENANELLYQEILPHLEEIQEAVIREGEWYGELKQITKNRQEIIVETRWTLVCDNQQKPKSILVVNTDVTEKKQLEAQFFRAQRLESLGTLASGIAHDLNNLLTPMLAVAELLPLKFPELDERTKQLLNILETNAKRGANLVKQVLSFAKGIDGKWTLLQIEHLVREVKQIIEETFPKNIQVIVDIPQDLLPISGDVTQINQVLINLCLNARDALPNGGSLCISAKNLFLDQNYARMNLEAKVGQYIVITIVDTGIGIDKETLERIFEPFFTTKEVGKGTGLGLSTVLGIVKSHGGFINVYSEVGQGTQFKVYLPTALSESEITVIPVHKLPEGNKELILVADDEAAIREVVKASLETYNYRVITASDGIEALAWYAQHKDEVSVVLLDMMMPAMDGAIAIRTLRKINPQVKIIAVSGLTDSDLVNSARNSSVNDILAKPFTSEELLQALAKILNS
ncbi:MAG: PAS domain S-box protein [Oscillatoria sp. PMC 1068.18]|nr:PAS domain S-box protein [Oscillatoria sp. PMC 1076.18]MEC4990479.1 PAS domain S-box protein [Oscillatoria sp. PMC 1068.18]